MLGRYTPFQILFFGFVILVLLGTLLLMLPFSSVAHVSQSFLDAFFMATSAVTTTGLGVVDTGTYYTLFGQVVIMILFQVGGLGYMIFIALMMLGLTNKLPSAAKKILHESLNRPSRFNMVSFARIVVLYTIYYELVCGLLMSLYWMKEYPVWQAIYLGVFHSISTFCTAGFALFSDSFMSYHADPFFNFLLSLEGLAGALGFYTLYELHGLFRQKIMRQNISGRLSTHSKLALLVTGVLFVVGTITVFFMQYGSFRDATGIKLMEAAYQVISASSTTGFNTVDIGSLHPASLFTLIVLMLIGASPGGTGGGIKTVTFGVLLVLVYSVLIERKDAHIFRRTVPKKILNDALVISFLSVMWMTASVLLLTMTESAPFLKIVFEAASAFGTVGLSAGITPDLSAVGKILISLSMFIGRVGPLTIGFSLMGKHRPTKFKYAETDLLVG